MPHSTPTGFFSQPIEVNLANLEATVDVRNQVANDSIAIGGDVAGTPTLLGAGTLVEPVATTQVGLDIRSHNYIFDGADFIRMRGAAPVATFPTTNISSFTNNFMYAFNSSTGIFNRINVSRHDVDALSPLDFGLEVHSSLYAKSPNTGLPPTRVNGNISPTTFDTTTQFGIHTLSKIYGFDGSVNRELVCNTSGELTIQGTVSTSPASTTIDQGHVSIPTGAGATQVRASDTTRRKVTIKNISSVDMYIGASDTVSTDGNANAGMILRPDDAITIESTAAIFAVHADAGSQNVAFFEELV